ncbi:hypothetical protein Tco_0727419 [Tanacetum coccineum]|uniref:Uncharacterized protein n=1 Tax=Tanacetum coccineum TaxID=301880 RepID=A0ABQ4YLB7_9ASTR
MSEYDEEEQNVLHFNDLFLFDVLHPDHLKSEKDNDDNDIDIIPSSEGMAPLPAADQRHPWLRYQIEEYTEEIRHSYKMSDIEIGLDVADTLCFHLGGDGSDRFIPNKGDLRDYWIKISYGRDFLGPAPSYVLIRDPVRRLCHRMIAYSISGRGQAPEKVTGVDLLYLRSMDCGTTNVPHLLAQYLFKHAEGRKSGARLSGGHFIGRLAMYFGLVSDEGLRGLQVVTRELPLIDLHELRRLKICTRYGDTWAWVAQGPERQQAAAAGAHEADEAERIERIEEEMHDLWRDVVGLRGVIESFTTKQSRVFTWLITCITQLIDAIGLTYQAFNSTLFGSSRMPYQRRIRPMTGDVSTFAAPHADDQPDP